jgi:hypothetical protein
VRELAWIGFCVLLSYPPAFAAAQEGEPDKEMLRMMELLRDWEMFRNFEMVRNLDSLDPADEAPSGGSAQKPLQKATKEKSR